MKKSQEEDFWHGKIKYKKDNDQDYEEEIDDPADVEKKIREGRAQPEMLFCSHKQTVFFNVASYFA